MLLCYKNRGIKHREQDQITFLILYKQSNNYDCKKAGKQKNSSQFVNKMSIFVC